MSYEERCILLANKGLEIDELSSSERRFHVHEMLEERLTKGEYHHLFPVLRKYPDKFYDYVRLSIIFWRRYKADVQGIIAICIKDQF